MAGSEERWTLLGRRSEAPPAEAQPPELPTTPGRPLTTHRHGVVAHHWLSLLVARPSPAEPIPVPGARITVRPYPRGAPRPEAPLARGATAPDGTAAFLLPPGRYAVTARLGDEGRSVTITLEHAGRATLLLDAIGRRVTLQIEASAHDGSPLADTSVEARAIHGGAIAARATTDADGIAELLVPPGAYEVRVGGTVTKTYLETDTLLRLTTDAPRALALPRVTRYAQRAREATSYAAPFEIARIRDDVHN